MTASPTLTEPGDATRLLSLLQQQTQLYQRVRELSDSQSELVRGGDSRRLLALLTQRQKAINQLVRRFDGSVDALGHKLVVDGHPMTVIGVMPSSFRLPEDFDAGRTTELLVPIGADPSDRSYRGTHFLSAVARLNDDTTIDAAGAEALALARRFERDYPDEYDSARGLAAFLRPLEEEVLGETRPALTLLLAAVGLLLLIACINVAGLQIARAAARRRELAVRSVLGAGRGRLVMQLLAESSVLALAGGALGILLAAWGTAAAGAWLPSELPRAQPLSVDLRMIGFALMASLGTCLLFGLAPAIQASRSDQQSSLSEAGRGATGGRADQRLRAGLVIGEIAIALILLAGAGLVGRSYFRLIGVDPGFEHENILTVDLHVTGRDYPEDEQLTGFFQELITRLGALPGVRHAGAIAGLPLATQRGDMNIDIEGRSPVPGEVKPKADWQVVTPGYLDAIGMTIVRGRDVRASDDEQAAGAVVINETLARTYWPDTEPIGRRFTLGGGSGPGIVTIVGVARDVRHLGLDREAQSEMYVPHRQFRHWGDGRPMASMTLAVRTTGDPRALVGDIRRTVTELDPNAPLSEFRTMEEVRTASVARPRLTVALLTGFSGLALVLAAVGLYGVMAFWVTRRSREIGIRLALGATSRGVAGLVLGRGLRLTLAGIGIGMVAALAAGRLLRSLLFEVSTQDPLTLVGVATVLAAVATIACWIPARRVARVDPATTLRTE